MEENKEKVGFFKRLGIAVARPKEYGKLANQKVGNTIGTFFVVSLVETILLMILVVLLINAAIAVIDNVIPTIPDFNITNGQLSINNSEPIRQLDEQTQTLIIVDTNITLDQVQDTYADDVFKVMGYMAITKDGIIVKQETSTQTQYFEQIGFDFDKSQLVQFYEGYIKENFKTILIITLFIFMLVGIFIGKLIGGLMFGVFAWLIASIQNKKLSFKKLFNIAMYAGVTTTLMFIFGGFILIVFPVWTGIKLVIISLYIIFAIKHIPSEDDNNNNVIETKIE